MTNFLFSHLTYEYDLCAYFHLQVHLMNREKHCFEMTTNIYIWQCTKDHFVFILDT